MTLPSPRTAFRTVATAEAITWFLLIVGMVLKYGTRTTELGVRVFGMVHGVVFIAYVLVTIAVAVDRRWPVGRLALGLFSAIPPFMTLWFERHAERVGDLDGPWRVGPGGEQPTTLPERALGWLVRNPVLALLALAVAVAALTAVALVVGPPVPPGR